MLLILYMISIIIGFFFRQSKIVYAYQVIIASITFGFANNIPDISNYRNTYMSVGMPGSLYYEYLSDFEKGYQLLCKIFYHMGINFEYFRTILVFIGLLLLGRALFKITRKPNLIFSLYLIYPFPIEIIQMRNGLAAIIVIYAMQYIIKDNVTKKDLFKYIIGIIIASLIQETTLIYVIYILMLFEKKSFEKVFKIVLLLEILVIIGIYMRKFPIISGYFEYRTSGVTVMLFTSIMFMYVLCIFISRRKLIVNSKKMTYIMGNPTDDRYLKFMMISLLMLPFVIFHFDFFRLTRNILIMLNIFLIDKCRPYGFLYTIPIILILVVLVYVTCVYGYEPSLIELIFRENLLI